MQARGLQGAAMPYCISLNPGSLVLQTALANGLCRPEVTRGRETAASFGVSKRGCPPGSVRIVAGGDL